jgi:hypothetical protein
MRPKRLAPVLAGVVFLTAIAACNDPVSASPSVSRLVPQPPSIPLLCDSARVVGRTCLEMATSISATQRRSAP